MRWAYEQLIYSGWTLTIIADDMNARGVPIYFKASIWNKVTLYQLVRSPVYKGVFYAHENNLVKTGQFNKVGRPKRTNITRPESEWIKVTVPAIVTEEEWQLAQAAMSRNAKRSYKNFNKREWLLSGLLKCALCPGYMMTGQSAARKKHERRYYRCNSNRSYKAVHTSKACGSPSVRAEELERRVWEEIERVIYDPGIIIKRLEERENEGRRMGYEGQISLIETQLKDLAHKRTKCEAAYQRDIYTLDEFKAKMKDIRAQTQPLETSRGKLEAQLAETNSIDDQKRIVLAALWRIRQAIEQAQQAGKSPDEILFILKRRIVAQIVEAVYVDTNKREFTIEGEIKGTYSIDTSDLQNNAESEVHSEIDPPQQHSQDDTKPGSPMSKGIDGQIGLVSAHIYTNPNQMSPLCSSVLSHSWWSRLETLGRAGSAAPSRSIDNLFGVVHLVNPAITIATESEANVALLCIGQCVRCQTGASAIAVFECVPSNVRHMMFTSLAAHPTVVVKVEQAELIKSQLLSPLRSMLRLRSNWIKCPQSFIQ